MNINTRSRIASTALFLVLTLMNVPAFGQADLSGQWGARLHSDWLDRLPGPDIGDYTGLPINEAARSVALTYTAAVLAMTERGCLYYTENYLTFAPHSIMISSVPDPVTGAVLAWKISAGGNDRVPITI